MSIDTVIRVLQSLRVQLAACLVDPGAENITEIRVTSDAIYIKTANSSKTLKVPLVKGQVI